MARRLPSLLSLGLAGSALAYKTDFKKPHAGMDFGFATLMPNGQSSFSPVAALGPENTYYSGVGSDRVLRLKAGVFADTKRGTISLYGLQYRNTVNSWNASGPESGRGRTRLSGWGAGAEIDLRLMNKARFRTSFALVAEYASIKANITMGNALLKLQTSASHVGGGLRSEIYLGDLWILGLLASYQYGFPQAWNVRESSQYMGKNYGVGALTDRNGETVKSCYGGYLLEAGLRLSFY